VPTPDGGDDPVWISGPGEGAGVFVGLGEEAVDGRLEIDERAEHAALEAPFGQLGEEALDRVEPGCRCRREVEDEARVPIQPTADLGVLVGGVVVEDEVDYLARRNGRLDGVEETDELLMPMALHAFADDLALQHVEGGEQGGGAVALVVVGHGLAAPLFERQTGLGAVERLDLALLIHRQDDGVGGRIDVEADDVANLGGELRIVGQLELTPAVRLEAMGSPDALDRTDADTDLSGHRRGGPVGDFPRRIGGDGQRHHPLGHLVSQGRNARRAGLVPQQAVHALLHEPLLPSPDRRLALVRPAHDFDGPQAVGSQKHDPRSPDVLLRAVAVRDHRLQAEAVRGAHLDDNPFAHPPDSHIRPVGGIRSGTLMLDFIQ